LNAAVYLVAAALHTGLVLSLGSAELRFPNAILPAAIVEGAIGVVLVVAIIVRRRSGLWFAYSFAVAGVLLGLAVGPKEGPDRIVHFLMIGGALSGLVLLTLQSARPGRVVSP
jgi:hypothetical protein